ncbi:hypothetical protein SmJEL517_g03800 [Synchytrium microbalum]|uniref:Uncharacterized protein n=1 Tax=Synchytrium microbalum TaxID=1806994 RepID=A0A507BUW7_9FUNG|nr:uncharacterized protein SmJEL517_g03800 [Synchytrium microbalum]TPX33230.1 hypothetical protein SmJEL517_g03800 [Synchytrium microbalum]
MRGTRTPQGNQHSGTPTNNSSLLSSSPGNRNEFPFPPPALPPRPNQAAQPIALASFFGRSTAFSTATSPVLEVNEPIEQPISYWDKPAGFVKTKFPLLALAASPDKQYAAVVGTDAINVLQVFTTEKGVETKQYPNLMSGTRNLDYQFSDVSWAPRSAGNRIATASLNGAVILWDVEKKCRERIIREQDRPVTISFHTTEPLLASACRDGMVRIWDVRDNKTAAFIFDGKCGDAFAARLNPVNRDYLVAGYENSVVKWDLRYPAHWISMISAPHSGMVQTCEWHADGHRVATAGKDKTIKIWSEELNKKSLKHIIHTLTGVSRIRWRPHSETQLAACFLQNTRIFLLDALQPHVPSTVFDVHKDVATSFLWYDSDTIWSCSRDKTFAWQDVRASYRPRELLSTSAMGWGLRGELTFAVESRGVRSVWCGPEDYLRRQRGNRRPASGATDNSPDEHFTLRQKAGVFNTGSFEAPTFTSLAKKYMLDSTNIWESCEHNAQAAASEEQYKAAQTWKIVQLLYGTKSIAPRSMAAMLASKPAAHSVSPGPYDQPDRYSPQPLLEPDPWLRQAALQPRPTILDAILDSDSEIGSDDSPASSPRHSATANATDSRPSEFKTAGDDFVLPGWDPYNVMYDVLEYYAAQGNVQMCVSLLHVLAPKIEVSAESAELWTWSYLDLLRRLQLWSVAADVISSTRIPTIKEIHKGVTPIYTGCGECRKAIAIEGGLGWMCNACKRAQGSCSFW